MTAIKERKKALAGSVVKIAGRDVMLSKKIMISIVMVPCLWIFYAVLLMVFTNWNLSTKVMNNAAGDLRAVQGQSGHVGRVGLPLFFPRGNLANVLCSIFFFCLPSAA